MNFSLACLQRGLLTSLLLLTHSVFTYASSIAPTPSQSSKAMPDKLYLSLGGYIISQSDMTIALSDKEVGAGVAIRPRDSLGIDIEQTVARIDGRYRFTAKHSLSFSVYRVASNSRKITENNFDWTNAEDEVIEIEAGADIKTEFANTILKLAYDWSFYHNDKVELYTSAGFNIAQLKLAVDVSSSVNVSNNFSAENIDSSLPLPTLGLGLNYRVNEVFYWYLKSQAFAIAVGDINASYSTSHFGFEYHPFNHFGIGLSYSVDKQSLTEKGYKSKLSYNNSLNGFNLYISTYF